MAENKLQLRVITPEKTVVDETVDMVILRCSGGEMGVLPGHQSHAAVLREGALRIKAGKQERRLAVQGGLATMRDNTLTVLTGEAEWEAKTDI